MSTSPLWKRYQDYLCTVPSTGFSLDISRMKFADDFFQKSESAIQQAFQAMDALEKGAVANPDENRMVGHYWLRAPQLAPTPELTQTITQTVQRIKTFASEIHSGKIKPEKADRFTDMLVIGI